MTWGIGRRSSEDENAEAQPHQQGGLPNRDVPLAVMPEHWYSFRRVAGHDGAGNANNEREQQHEHEDGEKLFHNFSFT